MTAELGGYLAVECGLLGCGAKPGEPCVNSVDRGPRSGPHSNRVARAGAAPAVESSTSARLLQLQRDLAASQADLSSAEQLIKAITEERTAELRELAAERALREQLGFQLGEARDELDRRLFEVTTAKKRVEGELDGARAQLDGDRALIDRLIADRAGLRKRLEQQPAQDLRIAEDLAGYCERCEGEISRGHAYTVTAGAENLLEHVHCPNTDASVSHTQVPECTTEHTEETRS